MKTDSPVVVPGAWLARRDNRVRLRLPRPATRRLRRRRVRVECAPSCGKRSSCVVWLRSVPPEVGSCSGVLARTARCSDCGTPLALSDTVCPSCGGRLKTVPVGLAADVQTAARISLKKTHTYVERNWPLLALSVVLGAAAFFLTRLFLSGWVAILVGFVALIGANLLRDRAQRRVREIERFP